MVLYQRLTFICNVNQVLHSKQNKNTNKTLIVSEFNGVKVELTKDFQMGVTNKTPEFIKMNPIGKVRHYII